MSSSFAQFFHNATGFSPYPYQARLACGEPSESAGKFLGENPGVDLLGAAKASNDVSEWLSKGTECTSRLIDIPTGLGKTGAVIMAWLWNRCMQAGDNERASWPRRLVYCLPMRTLVEQTTLETEKWTQNLLKAYPDNQELRWLAGIESEEVPVPEQVDTNSMRSPIILMGGEDLSQKKREWDIFPEMPAILIGTQDMLLSRALNRGYGMSRYRWPMHFALLNNDCLWVMDEVQLMGAGLASTTQFEGFRQKTSLLGSLYSHSWWMSATVRTDWLKTVDFPETLLADEPLRLNEEKEHGSVKLLRHAQKAIEHASLKETSKSEKREATQARFIAEKRSTKGLNLVVANTVVRARALHAQLQKLLAKEIEGDQKKLILLHSQFRPQDREAVLAAIDSKAKPGQIVVSTQVIEAGVDISAHTLFTELAPWSSLVQRFGRCNRWLIDGNNHYSDAQIYWFDLDETKEAAPYEPEQLKVARTQLQGIESAAIVKLEGQQSPDEDKPVFRHVIRRKDLFELFDTTPDLAGADIDIDRFIRDSTDTNVQVFWRDWEGNQPNGNSQDEIEAQPSPQRYELCSTNIGEFTKFLKKNGPAWKWDYLDRQWTRVAERDIYPGQTYLLHVDQGGYRDADKTGLAGGWTGNPKDKPSLFDPEILAGHENESNESDKGSQVEKWQSIAEHTNDVCQEMDKLLEALAGNLPDLSEHFQKSLSDILKVAARWHDWGKAHAAFQSKLREESVQEAGLTGPVAKAPRTAWKSAHLPAKQPEDENGLRRRHFRHELASALGVLHPESGFPFTDAQIENPSRDLAAYLIATHHGKVRLSIRSLPDEWIPSAQQDNPMARRFARGVWDGDSLPAVDLGAGVQTKSLPHLSLEPMELGLCEDEPFAGQPSWAERTLTLLDQLGPFALAYLESLLRAADARGSKLATSTNIADAT